MTTINNIMTTKLITIPVGTTIRQARDLMRERRIRHLPVVDEKQGIIGVLSNRDLPTSAEYNNLDVEFCMSSPAIYIEHTSPIKKAVYKILAEKISCLIITNENDDAVGIVTTDDILWYLVTQIDKDPKQDRSLLSNLLDIQTIDNVARQMSNIGI